MTSRVKRMIRGSVMPPKGNQMPKHSYGPATKVKAGKKPVTTGKAKSGPKMTRPGRKTTK